jgi:hypothetical protein
MNLAKARAISPIKPRRNYLAQFGAFGIDLAQEFAGWEMIGDYFYVLCHCCPAKK